MSAAFGLPDFRGSGGLWTSLLPPGINERDVGSLTQENCLVERVVNAWRFYGRALQICKRLTLRAGYAFLPRWANLNRHDGFVFTSNIDGHLQRAGFKKIRLWSGTVQPTLYNARSHAAARYGMPTI